jgi:NTE family protein
MIFMDSPMIEAHKLKNICGCDLITYLFQGGGALGSYQVGIFTKLYEAGYAPQWLVGTSIGAINAAIIAGNIPEKRIEKLYAFWDLISRPVVTSSIINENVVLRRYQNHWSAQATLLNGQPGFFSPRLF